MMNFFFSTLPVIQLEGMTVGSTNIRCTRLCIALWMDEICNDLLFYVIQLEGMTMGSTNIQCTRLCIALWMDGICNDFLFYVKLYNITVSIPLEAGV